MLYALIPLLLLLYVPNFQAQASDGLHCRVRRMLTDVTSVAQLLWNYEN